MHPINILSGLSIAIAAWLAGSHGPVRSAAVRYIGPCKGLASGNSDNCRIQVETSEGVREIWLDAGKVDRLRPGELFELSWTEGALGPSAPRFELHRAAAHAPGALPQRGILQKSLQAIAKIALVGGSVLAAWGVVGQ